MISPLAPGCQTDFPEAFSSPSKIIRNIFVAAKEEVWILDLQQDPSRVTRNVFPANSIFPLPDARHGDESRCIEMGDD